MLFKGNDDFAVNVVFENLEVKVDKNKLENHEVETVTVNGRINVNGRNNGRLIIEVRQALGGFIQNIIDRICKKDEKVSENQNKK